MKLIKLCAAALCAVMLLSACSLPKSADAQMDDIRNFIASCSDVALNAHITADYGDRIFSFAVKYEGNDTGGRIEVIKPEEIAGITAQVSYAIAIPHCSTSARTARLLIILKLARLIRSQCI